jgi:hypothetical protein
MPDIKQLIARLDDLEAFLAKIRQSIASEVQTHIAEAIKAKAPPADISDIVNDINIRLGNLSAEVKDLSRAHEAIAANNPSDDEIALSKKHVIRFMKSKGWYDNKGATE